MGQVCNFDYDKTKKEFIAFINEAKKTILEWINKGKELADSASHLIGIFKWLAIAAGVAGSAMIAFKAFKFGKAMWKGFTDFLSMMGGAKEKIVKFSNAIKNTVSGGGIIGGIKEKFVRTLNSIKNTVSGGGIIGGLKSKTSGITSIFGGIGSTKSISGATKSFGTLFKILWSAGKFIGKLFKPLGIILALFGGISHAADDLAQGGSLLGSIFDGLGKAIYDIADSLTFGLLSIAFATKANALAWIISS